MDDDTPPPIDLEHLWQFAGQGLRSSDFNTAMVHFYRGELARSNTWRTRLDATTNWAVLTTGAALTFSFGSVNNTPLVIIIDTLLVLLFLFMEARRYRYYELWTHRVRIMEQDFFAALLAPPFMPRTEWAERLTESLRRPRFPIGLLEAFGRRYRRNYAPIFLILALSWLFKIYIHPTELTGAAEFFERAAVGPISGQVMVVIGILFNAALIGVGFFSLRLHDATGEVLSDQGIVQRVRYFLRSAAWETLEIDLPRLANLDNRNQLVFIISDEVDAIGEKLMTTLGRGVTRMHGTGMYTGKEHGILLVAVKSGQVIRLKQLVLELDRKAFVMVLPVQDVHGFGFQPLET